MEIVIVKVIVNVVVLVIVKVIVNVVVLVILNLIVKVTVIVIVVLKWGQAMKEEIERENSSVPGHNLVLSISDVCSSRTSSLEVELAHRRGSAPPRPGALTYGSYARHQDLAPCSKANCMRHRLDATKSVKT